MHGPRQLLQNAILLWLTLGRSTPLSRARTATAGGAGCSPENHEVRQVVHRFDPCKDEQGDRRPQQRRRIPFFQELCTAEPEERRRHVAGERRENVAEPPGQPMVVGASALLLGI